MRLTSGIFSMVVVLTSSLSSISAETTKKMAIVGRVVAEGPEEVTDIDVDTAARAASEYLLELRPISRAEQLARAQASVEERLRACGADLGCVSRILEATQVDAALLVAVNLDARPVVAAIQVIRAGAPSPQVARVFELPYARPQLLASLRAAVEEVLTETAWARAGRLLVDSIPSGAEIDVGVRSARSPASMLLAPGDYEVRVSLQGHVGTSTRARIVAAHDQRLSFRLESERGILESPWLWTAVAAVVVGGIVAGWRLSDMSPAGLCQARPNASCE